MFQEILESFLDLLKRANCQATTTTRKSSIRDVMQRVIVPEEEIELKIYEQKSKSQDITSWLHLQSN